MLGAALSAIAALLHVGCIVFGASWYRFFGAGERMVRLAEAGDWRSTAITSAIVAVLSVWALYALSGAGAIPELPLLRIGLCAIAAVYSLRGLAGLLYAAIGARADAAFWWWSSAICLVFGIVHVAGLMQAWSRL
ncbi:MAG: hypothetical protein HOP03_06550 [Lysobacter sp.]|nr:hypothetical protein [Lysobacter sp.]